MAEAPKTPREDLLEDLFATARTEAQTPLSDDLSARLAVQAAQVQAGLIRQREAATPLARLRQIWRELGGWTATAGLATATVAGLWIGGASPDVLNTVLDGAGVTTVSLDSYFPDYDSFLEEI